MDFGGIIKIIIEIINYIKIKLMYKERKEKSIEKKMYDKEYQFSFINCLEEYYPTKSFYDSYKEYLFNLKKLIKN
jgi:hypothetical protein